MIDRGLRLAANKYNTNLKKSTVACVLLRLDVNLLVRFGQIIITVATVITVAVKLLGVFSFNLQHVEQLHSNIGVEEFEFGSIVRCR